jgi:hypothetical protein
MADLQRARGARTPWYASTGRCGGASRRQPFQPFQWVQEECRRAITPRPAKRVQQLSPRALRQSVERQRWAHRIAHEALKLIPARGRRDKTLVSAPQSSNTGSLVLAHADALA